MPDTLGSSHTSHNVIRVFVREVEMSIAVGKGQQTFKWLGFVAAFRYAQMHDFAHHPHQFVPVNVEDENKATLFPDETLASRNVVHNSKVYVELLGPKIGVNDASVERRPNLWELWAYSKPEDWREVLFKWTPKDPSAGKPCVFGNFNGWSEPMLMEELKDEPGTFSLQVNIPVNTEVVFRFVCGDEEAVSEYYDIVDTHKGRMNYFKVHPHPMDSHDYDELIKRKPHIRTPLDLQKIESSSDVLEQLSPRVVGAFQSVKEITDDLRKRMFERDWGKVQLADVCRTYALRADIKELMRENFEALRLMFQYYSSHGSGAISYMSVWEWIHFAHQCKVTDRKVNVCKLDGIFNRVNVEEVFDEDLIESDPEHFMHAMSIVPDPFNPDNAFIRGEFMEAIVRLALIKFGTDDPVLSTRRMLQEHVLEHGMGPCRDGTRKALLSPAVQRVYAQYAPILHALFKKACELDKSDLNRTTMSIKEFQMMLERNNQFDRNLPRRRALQAFALSQEVSEHSLEDNLQDEYEMVYAEFLEALGRLAQIKFEHEKMSLAQCLQLYLKEVSTFAL